MYSLGGCSGKWGNTLDANYRENIMAQRLVVALLLMVIVISIGCGKDEPDNGTLRPNANLVNVRF